MTDDASFVLAALGLAVQANAGIKITPGQARGLLVRMVKYECEIDRLTKRLIDIRASGVETGNAMDWVGLGKARGNLDSEAEP